MTVLCHTDSPLGKITLAAEDGALTGLWFDGQKYFGAGLPPEATEGSVPVFEETKQWLGIYFSGRDPGFTPPYRLRATPFREAVWEALQVIPFGQTASYGEIAARLTETGTLPRPSPRAVGGAVGRNPISLIIPCHRVVGADGRLTGYAGGTERKAWLLAMENPERTAR